MKRFYFFYHVLYFLQVVGYISFIAYTITTIDWLLILSGIGYGTAMGWTTPYFLDERRNMQEMIKRNL